MPFWAFLSQTLDADGSCRLAVTGVQTLCSAIGLELSDDNGYRRLLQSALTSADEALLRLNAHVTERLRALLHEGRRVLVMDDTSIRMPDSKVNATLCMQAPQQKPGCGFPLRPMLGFFDLNSGTWVAAVKSKGGTRCAAILAHAAASAQWRQPHCRPRFRLLRFYRRVHGTRSRYGHASASGA